LIIAGQREYAGQCLVSQDDKRIGLCSIVNNENFGSDRTMKKILLTTVMTVAAAAAVTQMPDAAQAGGRGFNQIGPSVYFGGGDTAIGINSKLGIADNLSLRPFAIFPSGSTVLGSSLTYDWDLGRRAPITPYLGAGLAVPINGGDTTGFFQGGLDYNINRNFALNGAVNVPFNGGNTVFNAGAAFRF
jgi:hypothetical protein